MQFLVLGFDGDDEQAPTRRQAARPKHLESGDQLREAGKLWYAAALTNDDDQMIGSMYMMSFANREELDVWLTTEPYVVGEVWKRIEIFPCTTLNPWRFNRPEEFFKK